MNDKSIALILHYKDKSILEYVFIHRLVLNKKTLYIPSFFFILFYFYVFEEKNK